ncbi:MAG: glycosyltransferase family 2 protein [Proteobacteria bacterium]|nr:glycosyltransferase family 2 protein [Pseudomonadota bacterium]
MNSPFLTIFTPTYNRGYILGNLYSSLLRQTCSDFEWVVVDDGSDDNTQQLVATWINENKISIVYEKQLNQGKHVAVNHGVKIASGELFYIVDSDDYLPDDTIEKIKYCWIDYPLPKDKISGIIGNKQNFSGQIVGTPPKINSQWFHCRFRDLTLQYGASGDKAVIYLTDILKRFPYPQFPGEKFMGESYVFNQIDDLYEMLFLNEPIYCCEYREDGLSQNFRKLYRNNPQGFKLLFEQSLRYKTTLKAKFKTMGHIVCLKIRLRQLSYRDFLNPISMAIGLYFFFKIFILKSSDVKANTLVTTVAK